MNSNEIYYVYKLIDPRINLPFYIGKGKNNRCMDHLKETVDNTSNINKFHRINEILNSGNNVHIEKIKENLDEESAYRLEEDMILYYGREGIEYNGILTNICNSSRPPSHKGRSKTEDHKQKISNAQKGKKLSEEHLKNLRIAAKQTGLKRRGYKHSFESIEKMRTVKKGKKFTDEHKANLSKALTGLLIGDKNGFYGKEHSIESKNKMSKSLKGKNRTQEFKDNLSKHWKGKPKGPMSEETKKKLSIIAKERAKRRKENG